LAYLFKEAKKAAGKKPRIMVTDSLQSYQKALKDVFFDYQRYSHHVADAGLEESLNNSLERLNGTVREREKVMRGLKEDYTPIIPMNKIYYNFIRPHQGLKGKTPAEMAGVGIEGENRWMGLLKRSTMQANRD
jgi:transposase-like protein